MDFAENDFATCGECGLEGPLGQIQQHFLQHFKTTSVTAFDSSETQDSFNTENINTDTVTDDSNSQTLASSPPSFSTDEGDNKLWPASTVLLLIRLVERNYSSFDTNMKKIVWEKIATELSNVSNKKFTPEQVDTKWKGLKRTFKKIKDHNSKTGSNRKFCQFFDAMDSFLNEKPEFEAPATCSSTSGLVVNTNNTNKENQIENEQLTPKTTREPLINKRKNENSIERRHKEKIKRLDRFLDLYQMAVEHQIGKKLGKEDESD